jgi:Tfp pilus assembly protein PilP
MQQRLTILRRKVLRDEDFNETDDSNRDPFRSFTGIFTDRGARVNVQQVVPSIFGKFALEELTLIAVITGDANPRAMFRDPAGLGQVLKRGDYLSKSAARVTKILSDRVVLELAEAAAGGETRALEKAILVDPEGADK